MPPRLEIVHRDAVALLPPRCCAELAPAVARPLPGAYFHASPGYRSDPPDGPIDRNFLGPSPLLESQGGRVWQPHAYSLRLRLRRSKETRSRDHRIQKYPGKSSYKARTIFRFPLRGPTQYLFKSDAVGSVHLPPCSI